MRFVIGATFGAVWLQAARSQAQTASAPLFYFAFKMRLDVVKSGHGKTTPD